MGRISKAERQAGNARQGWGRGGVGGNEGGGGEGEVIRGERNKGVIELNWRRREVGL